VLLGTISSSIIKNSGTTLDSSEIPKIKMICISQDDGGMAKRSELT
jgi:hypothetical protein